MCLNRIVRRPSRLQMFAGVILALGCHAAAAEARAQAQWHASIKEARSSASVPPQCFVVLFSHEEAEPASIRLRENASEAASVQAGEVGLINVVSPTAGPSSLGWHAVTRMADEYQIQTIPSVVVLDGLGKPVMRAEASLLPTSDFDHLLADARRLIQQRDQAMEAAASLSGEEGAAAMDRALKCVGVYWHSHYRALAQALVDRDHDGAMGYRAQYQPKLVEQSLDEGIQNRVYPLIERADYAGAHEQLESLAGSLPLSTGQQQLIRAFQAQLLYSQGDLTSAVRILDEVIALAPDSPEAQRVKAARAQLAELQALKETDDG